MSDDLTDDISPAVFTFFEAMPRQGPGSAEVTAALYGHIRPQLPENPSTADMGCGCGAVGLVLAEKGARVTGIDLHQPFLNAFRDTAAERGLGDRVETLRVSMTDTGLADDCLDLVWSEGAVYTVGFDAALTEFKRLLKPGGVAVVSDCSWLQADVPSEVREFWEIAYPGMRSPAGNLAAAETAGWRFLHAEALAAEVWESEFYTPMERLISEIAPDADQDLKVLIEESETEISLFRRYHDVYGYVFHVLQAP